jgi:hypothetical protein
VASKQDRRAKPKEEPLFQSETLKIIILHKRGMTDIDLLAAIRPFWALTSSIEAVGINILTNLCLIVAA